MRREQAREIGLFFLLGFMEERVAIAAASRAIAHLKAHFSDGSTKESEQTRAPVNDVIQACRDSWKSHRKSIPRNQVMEAPESAWVLPANLNIDTWSRYQKDAPDDDVMVLLFSLVLGFSDDELAEGFQTSVGTIRYRLGKGVRQLGLVARSNRAPATSAPGESR